MTIQRKFTFKLPTPFTKKPARRINPGGRTRPIGRSLIHTGIPKHAPVFSPRRTGVGSFGTIKGSKQKKISINPQRVRVRIEGPSFKRFVEMKARGF